MEALSHQSPKPETWADQFLDSLQSQRQRVRGFLAEHHARLERAEAALEAELRRLEEGVENATSPDQASAVEGPSGGRLDWEAEKRRILAALESDGQPCDRPQRVERAKIEDVLHTTERIIAEKDRRIAELTQRLAELGGDGPCDADRQTVIERLLDADALVQQERQRLAQLQEEWRDKLRQGEIDLSLQRAKLARERAELEERIRLAECAIAGGPVTSTPADRQKRSSHGRWLARLGLTEADRDDGKQDY